MLNKDSKEYWEEVSRLAELLKRWDQDRNSQEIQRQVLAAMQNLGLIVPVDQ